MPSRCGADRQVVGVVAGMRRSQQMLAPVLDPAHRMADLQRDRGDRNVLRHDPVLAAETAADIGRDHAHLVLRDAEHPRQRQALNLAALRRQIDDEFVEPVIPIGEHAAAFERHGGLPVEPQPAVQPDRRRGEDFRIAFDDAGADVGVARPLIEHARTVGAHRGHDIDDGRQFLEFDADLVGQVFGLRRASASRRPRSSARHSARARRPAADRGCGDGRRVPVRPPAY